MDNRPLTPQERIRQRRIDRQNWRAYLRHYKKVNVAKQWALILTVLLVLLGRFVGLFDFYLRVIRVWREKILISKFCNGLIGNSLTDSVTASAIN